jgi:hypothetical protein
VLSGSPDPSSTYRLPWESVHVLVILTPSAVDQNVLIRSVSRQSTAMAARRLDTGPPFSGERLSAIVRACQRSLKSDPLRVPQS